MISKNKSDKLHLVIGNNECLNCDDFLYDEILINELLSFFHFKLHLILIIFIYFSLSLELFTDNICALNMIKRTVYSGIKKQFFLFLS